MEKHRLILCEADTGIVLSKEGERASGLSRPRYEPRFESYDEAVKEAGATGRLLSIRRSVAICWREVDFSLCRRNSAQRLVRRKKSLREVVSSIAVGSVALQGSSPPAPSQRPVGAGLGSRRSDFDCGVRARCGDTRRRARRRHLARGRSGYRKTLTSPREKFGDAERR